MVQANTTAWRQQKRNSLLLWDAVKRGDNNKITEILDNGYDINAFVMDNRMTLLMTACSLSVDQSLFELILARQPDVNLRGGGNKTALHFAAAAGNAVALEILL